MDRLISDILKFHWYNKDKTNMNMRRTFYFLLLSIVFFGSSYSCSGNSSDSLDGVAKIVTYKYYEPVMHEEKWVCGKEITRDDIAWYMYGLTDHVNRVYVDKYGNPIVEEDILGDGTVYKKNEYYYSDPTQGKLSKKVEANIDWGTTDTTYYVRDNNGHLIAEIKTHIYIDDSTGLIKSYSVSQEHVYIRDMQGRVIEEKYGDKEKNIKYMDVDDSTCMATYEVYGRLSTENVFQLRDDWTMSLVRNGKVESGICYYDKTTGLLERKISESYNYYGLSEREDVKYVYDNEHRLVSEISDYEAKEGTYRGLRRTFIKGFTDLCEADIYYKEIYKEDNLVNYNTVTTAYEYDKYGYSTREYRIYGTELMATTAVADTTSVYKIEREYNEYGDVVKMIYFQYSFDGSIVPEAIVISEIKYQ